MDKQMQPIGIFDSGVGGLSVWRELVKVLPKESVIYYADTVNCPYGPKSKGEIIILAEKITNFLIEQGCKIIIVACNTATAAAIDHLRKKFTVPFIGMEPAVKPAALNSKTKSIAVLATEGTFNGKLYMETSEKYAKDVKLNIKVGDKLVDIVEKGLVNTLESKEHLKAIVKPLIDENIDHLVLGCTHYPFLTDILKELLPKNVEIVDPAPAVVKQTIRVLEDNELLQLNANKNIYTFYSSGNSIVIKNILKQITGVEFQVQEL